MKTTLDLPDDLLRQVRNRHGISDSVPVETIVLNLLRSQIADGARRAEPFTAGHFVGGEGVAPEFNEDDWATIQAASYGYDVLGETD